MILTSLFFSYFFRLSTSLAPGRNLRLSYSLSPKRTSRNRKVLVKSDVGAIVWLKVSVATARSVTFTFTERPDFHSNLFSSDTIFWVWSRVIVVELELVMESFSWTVSVKVNVYLLVLLPVAVANKLTVNTPTKSLFSFTSNTLVSG